MDAIAVVLASHPGGSSLDPDAFAPFLLSVLEGGQRALEDALAPLLPDPSIGPSLAASIIAAVADPTSIQSTMSALPPTVEPVAAASSNTAKTFFDQLQAEAAAAKAEAAAKRAQLGSTASSASRAGKKGQGRRRWEAADTETILGVTLPAVATVAGESEDVCRHFIAGSCLRADCPFLHDVASVPCRFYGTAAGCAYGDACVFRHAVDPPASSRLDATAKDGPEPMLGDEEPECISLYHDDAWTGTDADADAALRAAAATVAALAQSSGDDAEAGDLSSPLGAAVTALARSFGVLSLSADGVEAAASAPSTSLSDATSQAGTHAPLVTVLSDMSPESFPSLGGGVSSGVDGTSPSGAAATSTTSRGHSKVWSHSSLSMSSRLALVQLKREFPGVVDAALGAAWERCGRNIAATRKLLSSGPIAFAAEELAAASAWVPPLAAAAAAAQASAAAAAASSASPSISSSTRVAASRDEAAAAARIGASLAWVETGTAVASIYSEARAQAAAFARARNAAFDKATRAYKAGDGSAAAHFSRQGRDLDVAMRAAHASAAASIFAARNGSRASATASGGAYAGLGKSASAGSAGSAASLSLSLRSLSALPPPVVLPGGLAYRAFDLHGLHPAEAADVAMAALDAAEAAASRASVGGAGGASLSGGPDGRPEWVALLTGARHHSGKLGKGGGSVPAAVEAALQSCGAHYHVVGDQGAVIAVRLGSASADL